MKALYVFEYPPELDWMTHDFIHAIHQEVEGAKVSTLAGPFSAYSPGGLRSRRLLGLLWVYLVLPFRILFGRYDVVIARTTPPGIQHWAGFWGRMLGARTMCWMMDYHPEIEARYLERWRFGRVLAKPLRAIDRACWRFQQVVVVLDKAMADLFKSICPSARIILHPTWAPREGDYFKPVECSVPAQAEPLRILYGGNLGKTHPLETLERLLRRLTEMRPVSISVMGSSPSGEKRFRRLGDDVGVSVKTLPRTPFGHIGSVCRDEQLVLGLVVLNDSAAGLVAPSKYAAYLCYGLPMLYLGPQDTSSHNICTHFGAGYYLPNNATDQEIEHVAQELAHLESYDSKASNLKQAADYYLTRNGMTLLQQVLKEAPELLTQP
jgi:hypothetical protein